MGDSIYFLPSYFFVGKWLKDLVYWMVAGDAVRGPFLQGILVESPLAAVYAALVGTVVATLTGAGWRT